MMGITRWDEFQDEFVDDLRQTHNDYLMNLGIKGDTTLEQGFVRRHINWNTQRPDLREALVHLVGYIKRHFCGIACAGPSLF